MTQQEFETRVQMKVNFKEFEHINEVYMNSDLDKDQFCKLWVKMNQERVNKAKQLQKAIDEDMKQRDGLYDIINRDWSAKYEELATLQFTDTQKNLLDKVGIRVDEARLNPYTYNTFTYYKRVSEVIYDIKKYLKVA